MQARVRACVGACVRLRVHAISARACAVHRVIIIVVIIIIIIIIIIINNNIIIINIIIIIIIIIINVRALCIHTRVRACVGARRRARAHAWVRPCVRLCARLLEADLRVHAALLVHQVLVALRALFFFSDPRATLRSYFF